MPINTEIVEEVLYQAINASPRRAWKRWAVRLVIGVCIVTLVVVQWPALWWVALVYAPFPLVRLILLLRDEFVYPRQKEVGEVWKPKPRQGE